MIAPNDDRRRRTEQRGLWFEELELDVVHDHRPGRTFHECDDVQSTSLTMNSQALHLDEAWRATQEPFGRRESSERRDRHARAHRP